MGIIKNKYEQNCIKKACRITDQIFSEIVRELEKGRYFTELDLKRAIKKKIASRGLREAFSPIVSGGPRAGNEIHPKSTKSTLIGFVIIDFGVRVDGYCSDMTRTVFFGLPSKKEKDLYNLILKSQEIGILSVKENTLCASADKEARSFLGRYKKYFIHTLGHGVGRRIHERPMIYEKREGEIFKNGMVVTIEPGIYIKEKLGIRIEDTLLVYGNHPQVFTKSPKNLLAFSKR